jgi:hypothetical protein
VGGGTGEIVGQGWVDGAAAGEGEAGAHCFLLAFVCGAAETGSWRG